MTYHARRAASTALRGLEPPAHSPCSSSAVSHSDLNSGRIAAYIVVSTTNEGVIQCLLPSAVTSLGRPLSSP